MLNAKKQNNPIALSHTYLNYGLLGLASIIKNNGYDVILLHGKFEDPLYFSKKHHTIIKQVNKYPIFISLPSSFAIEWAIEIVNVIKIINSETSIVIGGRWVVMEDGKWIREKFDNKIDLVVYGQSENRILDLLDKQKWSDIPYTDVAKCQDSETWKGSFPKSDYSIMPDYNEFQPSIDISRGCGMGCAFCLESNIKLVKMKSPQDVVNEINKLKKRYVGDLKIYFEASHFCPTHEWCDEFKRLYREENLEIKWRTETRADSNINKQLPALSKSGLKILDIGLESASIVQLQNMKKTKNPSRYLDAASKLLKECEKNNIWTKINILLYPGENRETIDETIAWLDIHKRSIKGISVNPLMVYRNNTYREYLEELKSKYNATPIKSTIEELGYCYMNLSKKMQEKEIEEVRLQLCQRYMTAIDYYELKSFSYFSEKLLTKDEFLEICREKNPQKLPFRI